MQAYFDTIGWQPVIGDPTFIGWFTVLAYLVAAVLAIQVLRSSKYLFGRKRAQQKLLWLGIVVIMILLGLNKQLDLQTLFRESFRHLFIQIGLYGVRRAFQEIFLLFLVSAGFMVVLTVLVPLRLVIRKHLLALSGLFLLMVFIVLRAAAYNRLAPHLGGAGDLIAVVLELGGIALIIINSLLLLRRRPQAN